MGCKAQAARHRPIDLVERAAMGASFLCLLHCLALPLLLAVLPALSRVLALPESLHLWLLAFAIPSSALALGFGHFGHGARRLLPLGALGLAMMALGALVFAETWRETLFTVAGSCVLAAAHVANWRLRHAGHRHR